MLVAHRRVLVALVAASLLMLPTTALAGGSVGHDRPSCWVRNVTARRVGSDLRVAVFESAPGDTLKVRGTCSANLSIEHDLQLTGPATLDGGGGIVVWVNSGTLSLKDIKVTNGSSTFNGGGIYNYGTVTLNGSTSITGNIAEDGAGGIYNEGTVIMNGRSSVTGNSLLFGPGGGIWNRGTLVMNSRSFVTANSAIEGGGIYNQGTIVINGRSSVTRNTAETGGGIYNDGGAVQFSPQWRGTVCGNLPDDWPGCTGE